jgi:NDP-sugar pyrophosphorylase family protein
LSVTLEQVHAIVLAGGFGKRIQSLLPDLPKPMAPVNGKPFLEWVLRYLAAQGIRRVTLSTGYLAETIERHFHSRLFPNLRVQCVRETQPLGTAGGFLHALRATGDQPEAWLVLNGDTIAFADLADAAAALGDKSVAGVIFGREVAETGRYGSLTTDSAGNLTQFEEKRPGKGVISAGIYLFRDSLVKEFPTRVPLSMEQEVFPALTAAGVLLKVLPMNAPFLDIGTPESLREADFFIKKNAGRFQLETV